MAAAYPTGLVSLTAITAVAAQHSCLMYIPLAIILMEVLFYVWFTR